MLYNLIMYKMTRWYAKCTILCDKYIYHMAMQIWPVQRPIMHI